MKKKIISIFAAAMICASFTGCGDNSGSSKQSTANPAADSNAGAGNSSAEGGFDSKTAALKEAVTLPEMVSVKADTIKDRFGIEEADVTEVSAYICGSGAMPDEFGIFSAKDADAAKRIEAALNKRVEHQRKTFQDYTPAEMYKFDDCFVETNGTVVIYAICADNSKAKELLK